MSTTNSALPPLPYMRPMAKALPVEYESELSYYEYLNNLYSYINTNVRSAVDSIKWYIDERLPELEEDVETLQTQMTSVLSSITTINNHLAQHDSAISLINTLIDGLNNQIIRIDGLISTINGTLSQHNTQLNNLRSDVSALQSAIATINETLTSLQNQITALGTRLDTDELHISNNATDIVTIRAYNECKFRKSTSFTTGYDAWLLEDIFPTGTRFSDLFNKKVKIVIDFDSGTALTSNEKQTLNIGNSTENKTIDLSKVTTQALTTAQKSYVIELDFVKTTAQNRFDVFIKVMQNATTCTYYGGHLMFGQLGFDNFVSGLLTFGGLSGTGSVSVYY